MGPNDPNSPSYIERMPIPGPIGSDGSVPVFSKYGVGATDLVAQAQAAFSRSFISRYWESFLIWKPFIELLLWMITIAFIAGIIWVFIKLEQAKVAEKRAYGIIAEPAEPTASVPETIAEATATWQQVVEHVSSVNESDWRRAILEADIMLDTMLKERGYEGESLSDRLKSVPRSSFMTVDQAWDAHRVRNQIAHEGNKFALAQPEAKRIINMYEAVFREFKYI